ncbi:ACT domain-containing protein 2 [Elsinoe australis]|uniref:ACT domain-containing protein 2 n=1 Tax=Elsinoe australis TaxID=40998 RepID=A0A4U7AT58_9PEZI|nr:ACT domain-containing protein 2 [Elsinoe australis]
MAHQKSDQTPVSSTLGMITSMTPVLHPEPCVYATVSASAPQEKLLALLPLARAIFNEGDDGMSILLPLATAKAYPRLLTIIDPIMNHIELKVYSSLEGIGLTAAVAQALTDAKIPCNVIAALKHDHVYVPKEKAEAALQALNDLVEEASRT